MNIIKKSKIAVAALGALGLVTVGSPAMAEVLGSAVSTGNLPIGATTTLLATSGFNVNAGQSILVMFSSECAVNAGWTDIDIQLVNSVGAVVNTLAPTAGGSDAFCAANGTANLDGWSRNAAMVTHSFSSSGTFSIRVIGRLNAGATSASYGDSSLIVWR